MLIISYSHQASREVPLNEKPNKPNHVKQSFECWVSKNIYYILINNFTTKIVSRTAAVVITFFISWAPFHAQRLMFLYARDWEHYEVLNTWLFSVAGLFYYFSWYFFFSKLNNWKIARQSFLPQYNKSHSVQCYVTPISNCIPWNIMWWCFEISSASWQHNGHHWQFRIRFGASAFFACVSISKHNWRHPKSQSAHHWIGWGIRSSC